MLQNHTLSAVVISSSDSYPVHIISCGDDVWVVAGRMSLSLAPVLLCVSTTVHAAGWRHTDSNLQLHIGSPGPASHASLYTCTWWRGLCICIRDVYSHKRCNCNAINFLISWDISGPFYWHGLTLIPAWIKNHLPSINVGWNYLSIPKLQRLHRWSLGMDKLCLPTFYNGCVYLSTVGLKLNHGSKRGPREASGPFY